MNREIFVDLESEVGKKKEIVLINFTNGFPTVV